MGRIRKLTRPLPVLVSGGKATWCSAILAGWQVASYFIWGFMPWSGIFVTGCMAYWWSWKEEREIRERTIYAPEIPEGEWRGY